MSGNFAIKGGGGGVGRLMANAILNFHFDFLHTSLINISCPDQIIFIVLSNEYLMIHLIKPLST